MEGQMDTILEDFRVYLLETGQIQSEMTIESYLGNTRQLLSWLFDNERQLKDLDRLLMIKYLQYLKDIGYKATTYNTKVNSLISFNNYLRSEKTLVRNLVFGKDKIQLSDDREIEVYSDKEMELIEAYLESDTLSQRDRLIIQILKDLGLRTSELTNITLESLDLVGLQIGIHGKNNKRRVLPLKSSLAEKIKEYIVGDRKENKHHSSKYLFVSERADKLHRNTVLDITKKMGAELGIKAFNHKFRHTLASNMAKNVPIHLVQRALGHSLVQTTIDFYVNIDQDQLKDAFESV